MFPSGFIEFYLVFFCIKPIGGAKKKRKTSFFLSLSLSLSLCRYILIRTIPLGKNSVKIVSFAFFFKKNAIPVEEIEKKTRRMRIPIHRSEPFS